jgi:exopolysaccharide biosynthesis polyprenyl glycosylphosphotransferase
VNATEQAALLQGMNRYRDVWQSVDPRTLAILEQRRSTAVIKGRGWLMRRMLLIADLTGLCVAFALAEMIFGGSSQGDAVSNVAEALLFFGVLPVWVVAAKLYGLYDHDEERADHSTADDVLGVFHLVTVGTWLAYLASHFAHLAHPQLPKLTSFWVLSIVAVPSGRALARSRCRHSIHYVQNTLIVGAGDVGQSLARKILTHHEYGMNLVGFVDSRPKERAEDLEHLTLLGGLDDMPGLVRLLDVERVIVAFSNDDTEDMVLLVRDLNELDVQVDIVPRFFDLLSPSVDIHSIEGVPLIGLRPPHLSHSSAILKRCLDVAGAVVGLLLLAPVFCVIAVAIKLDSPGPVFFRQVRMGRGDKTFRIVKFRTMVADAEQRKSGLAHLNKHARAGGDARMFKIDDDPRVTDIGRVLRRLSLDELPQLWNVVRGDMSLVGPRPLILDEHMHVVDWAERRLDLRPGVTGLWQVLGRDRIPFEEMVKLDYVYVTSWSLWNDCRLLLRTFPVLTRSEAGRRRGPHL